MQSFLSLGHLHIPVFSLFAAAGLMCAMALGLRTAHMARIDPDALWDTVMVAVLSAFVLTRGLLVIENLHTFLMYPTMVLALPTLNLPGIALAVVAAVVYIRRRRLPLLNTLDAISPCAALLAAFLYAGRMAEGTREGMLTSLPWAIPSSFGRVHPVEIYSSIASLLLCGVFLWILGHQRTAGEAAAWAMVLGGLLQFVMCFFRLPQVLYSDSLLDGSQVRALYLTVAGGLLLAWRVGFGAPIPLAAKDAGDAI